MSMKPEYEQLQQIVKNNDVLRALLERDYTIMGLARLQPNLLDEIIANIRKSANPDVQVSGDVFGMADFKQLAQDYPEHFKAWLYAAASEGRNVELSCEMLINFITRTKPPHRNRKPSKQEKNEQIIQAVFGLANPKVWEDLYPEWIRSLLQEAAQAMQPLQPENNGSTATNATVGANPTESTPATPPTAAGAATPVKQTENADAADKDSGAKFKFGGAK